MPKFQIGDRVNVLLQGREIEFEIRTMSSGPRGVVCADDAEDSGWWPEDQLALAMTPEGRKKLQEFERDHHNLTVDKKKIVQSWEEVDASDLQPSIKQRCRQLIAEVMGWSGWYE